MILCCGEALIDMLPRETAEGEDAFAPYPGGALLNCAVALGRLGMSAGYFGALSTDLFGTRLEEALSGARVDISLCPRSALPTTLAFVRLRRGQASYHFYDENTAGRMLNAGDLPTLPRTVSALVFGGTSLVTEPCADAYAALMTREAGRRLTMIDPNIRPGLVSDEPRYRARLEAMLAAADIVKVSDEDLVWLTGGDDPGDLLATSGAAMVLVTRGAEGVLAITETHRFRVPAKRATVVDTVGAGDTFNAGFLAGLAQAELLERDLFRNASPEALRPAVELGVAAAAVTVSRAGANPPWAEELA